MIDLKKYLKNISNKFTIFLTIILITILILLKIQEIKMLIYIEYLNSFLLTLIPGFLLSKLYIKKIIQMDLLDFVSYSFIFSFIYMSIVGLILDYSPYGISFYSVIFSILIFVLIMNIFINNNFQVKFKKKLNFKYIINLFIIILFGISYGITLDNMSPSGLLFIDDTWNNVWATNMIIKKQHLLSIFKTRGFIYFSNSYYLGSLLSLCNMPLLFAFKIFRIIIIIANLLMLCTVFKNFYNNYKYGIISAIIVMLFNHQGTSHGYIFTHPESYSFPIFLLMINLTNQYSDNKNKKILLLYYILIPITIFFHPLVTLMSIIWMILFMLSEKQKLSYVPIIIISEIVIYALYKNSFVYENILKMLEKPPLNFLIDLFSKYPNFDLLKLMMECYTPGIILLVIFGFIILFLTKNEKINKIILYFCLITFLLGLIPMYFRFRFLLYLDVPFAYITTKMVMMLSNKD